MENQEGAKQQDKFLGYSILIAGVLIAGSLIYSSGFKYTKNEGRTLAQSVSQKDLIDEFDLQKSIIPEEGVSLPVKWGNLGKQLIESGTIDVQKFEELYNQRGLSEADKKLIYADDNGDIVINRENSGIVLNLLWALGLANKNAVLEQGPMMDSRYGGAGGFASTGGWTLAKGGAMEHYSKHLFVTLTPEEQLMIERVAQSIYRPCCDNSTHFPDCNHGMAMLGFLELAASQGASESALYQMALILNSYWFPENYLTIAKYLSGRGMSWEGADAKEILGKDFSSASGYQEILAQVTPVESQGGGGCSV